jgi:NhaP-type Na+/H+ or K+/H+ antiporter
VSESFHLLLALASVIVLGIAAQWLAWRVGVASILLLLLAGFLAGPVSARVLGWSLVDTDELLGDALVPFVSIAVALILYEGGLTLRLAELREARFAVWRLVTLGAAITWVLTALAAWLVLELTPPMSVLLGAILVVTGPTVIVPLLIHIRPSGRVGAIVKWEGIVIDPIGAMFAVLVFEAMLIPSLGEAAPHVAGNLVATIVVGGAFGFAAGMAVALVIHWFWVPDYLENAVSIMFVVGAYTAAHSIQPESGLLAAVVMGITLANQRLVAIDHIVEFKENLRVLIISSLFILLGATVRLDDFDAIGWRGLAFLGLVVLVVRPASVFLCTLGLKMSRGELAFLSVMGPRGIVAAAVASVFALRLQAAGYPEAGVLVPLTFLVIIGTVAISSFTAPSVAHRLGLADIKPQGILFVGAHAWGRLVAEALQDQGFRVLMVDTNRADLAAARMAGLETLGESILGEHLLDGIDLGGLGRLVAATPNDWVNVLAVRRFLRVFGRSEVYQVPPRDDRADGAHRHLHGRRLFGEALTCDELARRVRHGAVIRSTTLTGEFTYRSFRSRYGESVAVLFVVTAARRLSVITADQAIEPKPGDTLISLVDAEADN